ncbi:uncharacterized protein LOC124936377 isoform X1 [Impatiens glandulifera]|uniref:uncharacterized protein LOC124936377 isoform X1 n=1 Tax=Impatiens glandulifera TaxID=253017 RepID=UPI001FB11CB2|nr:uncharacterized protein LOC124936377 isoform X1 [Impatiens glandulifera]
MNIFKSKANMETQEMIVGVQIEEEKIADKDLEKRDQHAKDCSEKSEEIFENSRICLKCGNAGHYMFCCPNDYSHEDLKEIKCYICKRSGHLCCADFNDPGPRELSCYNCGELGHSGSKCKRPVTEESISNPPYYSANKVQRRNLDKQIKYSKRKKPAPSDLVKSHKKAKTQSEASIQKLDKKVKHSKGKKSAISSKLVNSHKKASDSNRWRSPATPINRRANFNPHIPSANSDFNRSARFDPIDGRNMLPSANLDFERQFCSPRFHPIDGRNLLPSANFDFERQFHLPIFHPNEVRNVVPSANFDFERQFHSARFHPNHNRNVDPFASFDFERQFHSPRFHPNDNRNGLPSTDFDFERQLHSPRFHPNEGRNGLPYTDFDFERQFYSPRFHPNEGRNGFPSADLDFDRSTTLHQQQFHLPRFGDPIHDWVRGNYSR